MHITYYMDDNLFLREYFSKSEQFGKYYKFSFLYLLFQSEEQTLGFATWFGCIVTSVFCMMTAMAIIGYRQGSLLNFTTAWYMYISFVVTDNTDRSSAVTMTDLPP